MASVAALAQWSGAAASGASWSTISAAAAAQAPANDDPNRDIIIYAPPLFRDLTPERQLDEELIEGYGASTIDELLGELQVELGDDADQPLILVNGRRINDISEIGAFPVEIVRSLQILPPGSAVRAGGRTGQRVVNIQLKRQARRATLTGAHKLSTDGDWNAERGEAILTHVRGDTRANLSLRGRDESALLESDRGIIQPAPRRPFAIAGNLTGFPDSAGEIDPVLSALAGRVVTVAPVPGLANPALADFVANANDPAVTDLGAFRTLRPDTRNYDINGTFATRLAPWLTSNSTLRFNRNTSQSLRGLPSGLFVLSPDNAFSPFSDDVALAFYGPEPLRSRSRRRNADANLTLNATFGSWQANFNANHQRSTSSTRTERQSSLATMVLEDDVNPFATDLPALITRRTDSFRSRTIDSLARLTATGPALQLPAGPLITTVEGRLGWNRQRSSSTFANDGETRRFRRSEQGLRGALEIPLASRDSGFLAGIGELDATGEFGWVHMSDAGSANRHALGLNWEPTQRLRFSASFEKSDLPPSIQILGDPVIVAPDIRMFDPLLGETVDVVQITGGNPDLRPQVTKLRRLHGLVRLVPRLNLQLNAEYRDTDQRNFVSSLPEASAAVMLAFPDRFVRDSSGRLTTVDLRPVNFDSHREKRLRWGLSMNTKLGGGRAAESPAPRTAGGRRVAPPAPTTVQLSANHSVVFEDKIRIRPGLDRIDLLEGGAIGIAGGRVRHQLDGTGSINSRGLGARMGVSWRGRSTLESRIGGVQDTLEFSPLLAVNLRAFADMKRFFPKSDWAKSLRVSLDANNIFNDRQSIRDSFGNTPLQYQPGYRDPIGRTVELEIRKVF